MAKKYKLTGCARFFIFLLIVGPLVYFGVSYFTGENPVEPMKELIKETTEKVKNTTKDFGTSSDSEKKSETKGSSDIQEDAILDGTIKAQKTRIAEQAKQIKELQNEVQQLKAELNRQRKRDVPVQTDTGN